MTLTKADLVEKISMNGFSKVQSFEVVEALLELMKQTLGSGEDIMISGFGKFCVKEKDKRRGRKCLCRCSDPQYQSPSNYSNYAE